MPWTVGSLCQGRRPVQNCPSQKRCRGACGMTLGKERAWDMNKRRRVVDNLVHGGRRLKMDFPHPMIFAILVLKRNDLLGSSKLHFTRAVSKSNTLQFDSFCTDIWCSREAWSMFFQGGAWASNRSCCLLYVGGRLACLQLATSAPFLSWWIQLLFSNSHWNWRQQIM